MSSVLSGSKRPRDDEDGGGGGDESKVEPRHQFNVRPMEAFHKKRTNDSIHSTIDLCPVMQVLMNSQPYFQRLRKLKQLGVSEAVYVTATHNRKEHSLGVAHLAERMLRRIGHRQPQLGIAEKDVLCVKLAGLCHDLGHGAYSHVYDGPFLEAMRADQAQAARRSNGDESSGASASAATLPPIPDGWTHEDASMDMIDAILRAQGMEVDESNLDGPLRQIGDGVDAQRFGLSSAGEFGYCPDDDNDDDNGDDNGTDGIGKPYPKERLLTSRDIIFIKECINGGPLHNGSEYVGRPDPSFEYLYDVVSNRHSGLDVDKIDYFGRDQRQCHKGSGEVEHLLIEDAFVAWGQCPRPGKCFKCRDEVEDVGSPLSRKGMHLMICYPDKMVHKALEFFKTRFRLHSEIYTHRTAKGSEFMVCDILKLADPFFRLRAGPQYPTGLPISRAMLDSTAYSLLNDSILDMILSSPDPRLLPAQRLIERYECRDFYKYVAAHEISHDSNDATNLLWERTEEDITSELCQMHACHSGENGEKIVLDPSDIIVEKMEIHHGRGSLNPVDMMRFLPKGKLGQLSRPVHELPVAEQQLEEVYYSSIPKAFNERSLRVFSRNTDPKHFDLLKHAFEQWCDSVMEDGQGGPNTFQAMEEEEEDDYDVGVDGSIANISQDDLTPPRRGVLSRNMKQVSVDHNGEEVESPKPASRGPTSLFRDGKEK